MVQDVVHLVYLASNHYLVMGLQWRGLVERYSLDHRLCCFCLSSHTQVRDQGFNAVY